MIKVSVTGLLGLFGLFALVGCASQMVQKQANDRCTAQGKRLFIVESAQAGIPLLIDTASVTGYCIGPDDIVHTNPAFGVELVGAAEIHGAGVMDVSPNSIAGRAGIKVGDVIVEYSGQPIERPDDLKSALAKTSAGDRVQITLRRKKDKISTTVQF
jgi:predicted metalloprotease with PDZ domain